MIRFFARKSLPICASFIQQIDVTLLDSTEIQNCEVAYCEKIVDLIERSEEKCVDDPPFFGEKIRLMGGFCDGTYYLQEELAFLKP